MAYSPQSVRFSDVVLALKARLTDQLGSDQVRVVKGGGYSIPAIGEQHFRVRPLRRSDFGEWGGGRYGLPVTRTVAVDCFVRSGLDVVGEDEAALTEADAGLFDVEDAVVDAITYSPLTDGASPPQPLLLEPPKFTQPSSDPDQPEPKRYTGYLVSTVYVEVKYAARLRIS